MAKYTINYACVHGSYEEQLFGKSADRERKIEWAQSNKVCPACYKDRMIKSDAEAEKIAKICLVPSHEPIISIEVSGQMQINKDALYALGYRWSDSTSDGLMGMFSMSRPKRAVDNGNQAHDWIIEQSKKLEELGYKVAESLNPLDLSYLAKLVDEKTKISDSKNAAIAALEKIKEVDPKPDNAPLRKRIDALQKETGATWNGKIYGAKGSFNFYINNVKYLATDAEVSERQAIIKRQEEWNEKYKAELTAAK